MIFQRIELAFRHRTLPIDVLGKRAATSHEYEEALKFQGLDWRSLDVEFLSENSDALAAFCPEAFRYYLPAFIAAEWVNDLPGFFPNVQIIGGLDRSPCVQNWEEHFIERWFGLTPEELAIIHDWILWLVDKSTGHYSDDSLERALSTVEILRESSRRRGGDSVVLTFSRPPK